MHFCSDSDIKNGSLCVFQVRDSGGKDAVQLDVNLPLPVFEGEHEVLGSFAMYDLRVQ